MPIGGEFTGPYDPGVPPSVAWISVAPVKGLRLEQRSDVLVTETGIPGDRAFFIVDERTGAMVSATRLGPLVSVIPAHDAEAGTLTLRFPDGAEVGGPVELGAPEPVDFDGRRLSAPPVLGGFSGALAEHCAHAAAPVRRAGGRGRPSTADRRAP